MVDLARRSPVAPRRLSCSKRQAHRPTRVSLQRSMHCAGVAYEVRASPRIAPKELVGQHVALEAITWRTRRDQVALRMGSSLRNGVHVIERRDFERQGDGTVDAASATITHGSVLERTLEAVVVGVPRAAR